MTWEVDLLFADAADLAFTADAAYAESARARSGTLLKGPTA